MPSPTETRNLQLRIVDLPPATGTFAYQATYDPVVTEDNPGNPTEPETSHIVGSDNKNGRGYAVLHHVRPGWTRVQAGNLWSDPFFWDGDPSKILEFSAVGGKLVRAGSAGGGGGPVIPPDGAPDITPVSRQFTKGTFTAGVSLYGLGGAPLDRAKRDMSRFRAAGFGNARVWLDWDYGDVTGSRALDEDGNFIEDVAKKIDELLLYGLLIGMSFDFTLHANGYRFEKRSAEGYDIQWHKRAVRNVLTRWGKQAAFRILDVANEAEIRGGPSGQNGSPEWGHVSPGRFAELMEVARSVPHTCLVSASVSASVDGFPKNYLGTDDKGEPVGLFRSAKGDILLPHFSRGKGWGIREGSNAIALMKAIPGIPLYHQEPARNGHSTQPGMWPVDEFEQSFKTSRAAGSVGCCFHGDFGFDMRTKDAWDQLDPVEKQVVERVAEWIK